MAIYIGSDFDKDTTLSCDVCIVGSGAGGAVMAEKMATAGKKVVVLEDGGYHTSDTFTLEERWAIPNLYQEAGTRATVDGSLAILQGRAVGGTTVVNWTTCFRTPERVMTHWQEHHDVELTHAMLEPHWAQIEERLGVVKMQLSQVNKNNLVTWRGLDKLGWHKDLLSRNVRNCAHTGFCGHGLAIGPVVGRYLADWISSGDKPAPLTPFPHDRFKRWLRTRWTPAGSFEATLATDTRSSIQTSDNGMQAKTPTQSVQSLISTQNAHSKIQNPRPKGQSKI